MRIDDWMRSVQDKRSAVVVGLDPQLDRLPTDVMKGHGADFDGAARSILEFNKGIVDAVLDVACAVKPQVAFYEQYGIPGMQAYRETCAYADAQGLQVIGDIKRGDIGSTSRAYSVAHLGQTIVGEKRFSAFPSHWITVNPYLGDDCLKEFMEDIRLHDKGMFVLVKTSNASSGQLQDLMATDEAGVQMPVYSHVARLVSSWSEQVRGTCGYAAVGAVVGATYPEMLGRLRRQMPYTPFLVPGYGAQGGGAPDVVEAFDDRGLGAFVNSSRGILYAYEHTGGDYKRAAHHAAVQMRDAINSALKEAGKWYL